MLSDSSPAPHVWLGITAYRPAPKTAKDGDPLYEFGTDPETVRLTGGASGERSITVTESGKSLCGRPNDLRASPSLALTMRMGSADETNGRSIANAFVERIEVLPHAVRVMTTQAPSTCLINSDPLGPKALVLNMCLMSASGPEEAFEIATARDGKGSVAVLQHLITRQAVFGQKRTTAGKIQCHRKTSRRTDQKNDRLSNFDCKFQTSGYAKMKFFRKIRLDLVERKKTGKYVGYALGEIVLVVIGILIALQINSWNESRRQATREEQFIAGVKNDLRQDRDFIELVIEIAEPRIEAYKRSSQELPESYDTDRETLVSIFQTYFVSQRTFYPISGSFQSAISGNEINNYENKDVIRAIIKLYNSTYARLVDNGEQLDGRWDYLGRKYSYERRTGQIREMNPEQISDLLDDIYHHYTMLESYSGILKDSLLEIDALLKEN